MSYLEKTWAIRGKNLRLQGAICVGKKGVLISASSNLQDTDLEGRCHSGSWKRVKVVGKRDNLGLAVLEVVVSDEEDEEFEFFDVERGREDVVVARGAAVQGILHSNSTLFTPTFGCVCLPFPREGVVFPHFDSDETVKSSGGSYRRLAWKKPVDYLTVGHVADEWDDGGEDDDDNGGLVSGMKISHFHPALPVIQVYKLGYGEGFLGCPVLNDNEDLLGMYLFDKEVYEYVIPTTYLSTFHQEMRRMSPVSLAAVTTSSTQHSED